MSLYPQLRSTNRLQSHDSACRKPARKIIFIPRCRSLSERIPEAPCRPRRRRGACRRHSECASPTLVDRCRLCLVLVALKPLVKIGFVRRKGTRFRQKPRASSFSVGRNRYFHKEAHSGLPLFSKMTRVCRTLRPARTMPASPRARSDESEPCTLEAGQEIMLHGAPGQH
jgi:hypothetical protein